jgi:hypothetical protein
MITDDDIMTGPTAAEVPMESWRLRRMVDRGLCPKPRKIGRYSVFSRSDISAIREAARKLGWTHEAVATA